MRTTEARGALGLEWVWPGRAALATWGVAYEYIYTYIYIYIHVNIYEDHRSPPRHNAPLAEAAGGARQPRWAPRGRAGWSESIVQSFNHSIVQPRWAPRGRAGWSESIVRRWTKPRRASKRELTWGTLSRPSSVSAGAASGALTSSVSTTAVGEAEHGGRHVARSTPPHALGLPGPVCMAGQSPPSA
jgi:hypothetical protein